MELSKSKTITFLNLKISEKGLIFEKNEEIFEVVKLQFVKKTNEKVIRLNPSTLNKIHINFDITILEITIWYKTADELTIEKENLIKLKMLKTLNKRIVAIQKNIDILKSFIDDKLDN